MSCRTKASSPDGVCPVCGIEQEKGSAELSSPQKRVRRAARHIRWVAILHVLVAIFGIMMFPEFSEFSGPGIIVAWIVINSILAVGLIRFSFWGYRIAVTAYFFIGIVFTIKVVIPGILLALFLLYFVGNGTAKAIFERRARQLA